MRKLLRKLETWRIRDNIKDTTLTKWQRDNIYDFIIQFIEEVTKNNG